MIKSLLLSGIPLETKSTNELRRQSKVAPFNLHSLLCWRHVWLAIINLIKTWPSWFACIMKHNTLDNVWGLKALRKEFKLQYNIKADNKVQVVALVSEKKTPPECIELTSYDFHVLCSHKACKFKSQLNIF